MFILFDFTMYCHQFLQFSRILYAHFYVCHDIFMADIIINHSFT